MPDSNAQQPVPPADAPQAADADTAPSTRRRAGSGPGVSGPRASLKQLLPYLFEQRGLLAFIIALSLVSALVSLSQPLLVGQVIERVQQADPLGTLVIVLVVLVVAGALLDGYQHYLLQRMGEGVVLRSRRRLIAKILTCHLRVRPPPHRRSRVARWLRHHAAAGGSHAGPRRGRQGGSLLFVGALVGMLVIDPVLFLITFSIIESTRPAVVVVLLASRIRPAVAQAQEKVGDLAAAVDRAIGSMRTIRAAGAAADREQAAIEQQAEEAYGFGLKIARISALIVPISFIALQVSLLSVLGFGGYRVATGAIGVSQLGHVRHLPVHDDHPASPGLRRLHCGQSGARRPWPHPR